MATLGVPCDMVASYPYIEITHDHNFIISVDFSQNVSKIRVKPSMAVSELARVGAYILVIIMKQPERRWMRSVIILSETSCGSSYINLDLRGKPTPKSRRIFCCRPL